MSEEDKSLFLEAMQGVEPLKSLQTLPSYNAKTTSKTQNKIIKQVKRKYKRISSVNNDEQHLSRNVDFHTTKVGAFDSMLHYQKGLRIQDLSKLKKGEFNIECQLDLHGLTQEQAEIEVLDFIYQAYQHKVRYLRIIHGKGYNSEEEYPILKNLVNQLLRQIDNVLAFCSAPEKDGGVGAVNVFLRAH